MGSDTMQKKDLCLGKKKCELRFATSPFADRDQARPGNCLHGCVLVVYRATDHARVCRPAVASISAAASMDSALTQIMNGPAQGGQLAS